jgi:hypothetical protein
MSSDQRDVQDDTCVDECEQERWYMWLYFPYRLRRLSGGPRWASVSRAWSAFRPLRRAWREPECPLCDRDDL